jgi:C-terminal processing protease CtpA/Prc
MKRNFLLGLVVFYVMISFGCSMDDNLEVTDTSTSTQLSLIDLEYGTLEISDFIWKGLNEYYYWQEEVELLSDDVAQFGGAYSKFISSNSNPEDFFSLLKHPDDQFSFLYNDYRELENSFEGVTSTRGVEFGLLYACRNCNELIGYVKYILEGSNAVDKNIKRGDLFIGVNGTTLTASNYRGLLFGNQPSITLNMAAIVNGNIVQSTKEVELVKQENFKTNPIQIAKVLELSSVELNLNNKVGYLMYNQFLAGKGDDLNQVFNEFKIQEISDLVLDLRYNGGGSIQNCIELSSMITGQFKNQIFAKENWNSKLEPQIISQYGKDKLVNRFVSFLSDGQVVNSLELNRVFVITSPETASASELLINGLTPYIEVIHVGEQTVGKNVGSITVYDYIDNNINLNHTYAMQPIVFKLENSEGFVDYSSGLVPDYYIKESIQNLGILGSKEEPLLRTVLGLIGGTQKTNTSIESLERIKWRRLQDPLMLQRQRMYSQKILILARLINCL